MKRSTKPAARKLNRELVRIIRGMRGASAKIAAVGHLDKSYVSRVIAGVKPPSRKFLLALDTVLAGAQRRVIGAIIRHAHPEIEA